MDWVDWEGLVQSTEADIVRHRERARLHATLAAGWEEEGEVERAADHRRKAGEFERSARRLERRIGRTSVTPFPTRPEVAHEKAG